MTQHQGTRLCTWVGSIYNLIHILGTPVILLHEIFLPRVSLSLSFSFNPDVPISLLLGFDTSFSRLPPDPRPDQVSLILANVGEKQSRERDPDYRPAAQSCRPESCFPPPYLFRCLIM